MFKLKNLLQSFIFPILLVADFTWLMGFGWVSLISFISLLCIITILIGYSIGTIIERYLVLVSLILANASLMINQLFKISWFNFSSLSMLFFVIGVFLSIRTIADSIDEYKND